VARRRLVYPKPRRGARLILVREAAVRTTPNSDSIVKISRRANPRRCLIAGSHVRLRDAGELVNYSVDRIKKLHVCEGLRASLWLLYVLRLVGQSLHVETVGA
jgi:hypothetical protein